MIIKKINQMKIKTRIEIGKDLASLSYNHKTDLKKIKKVVRVSNKRRITIQITAYGENNTVLFYFRDARNGIGASIKALLIWDVLFRKNTSFKTTSNEGLIFTHER